MGVLSPLLGWCVSAIRCQQISILLDWRTRLVDVPRHDRRAEQVTGAHSDSPDGRVGVEESKGYARIVSPSMVKCEATIDVSFDPKNDVLPRDVFQTHTNGPAIAPIDEIRELPTQGVHCT